MKTWFKRLFNISKYSKETRLSIYRDMKEIFEEYYNTGKPHKDYGDIVGFCYLLEYLDYNTNIKRDFPELWSTKPKENWEVNPIYWFSPRIAGAEQRLYCLEEAIQDLEIKLGYDRSF